MTSAFSNFPSSPFIPGTSSAATPNIWTASHPVTSMATSPASRGAVLASEMSVAPARAATAFVQTTDARWGQTAPLPVRNPHFNPVVMLSGWEAAKALFQRAQSALLNSRFLVTEREVLEALAPLSPDDHLQALTGLVDSPRPWSDGALTALVQSAERAAVQREERVGE